MSGKDGSDWLDLVLKSGGDTGDDVDVIELHKALESFHRLTYLICAALIKQRGDSEPMPSVQKLRANFDRTLSIRCRPAQSGSYSVPINIRELRKRHTLSLNDESNQTNVLELQRMFSGLFLDVVQGSHDSFIDKFPDIDSARRVAKAIERLRPSKGHTLLLRSPYKRSSTIFDTDKDLDQMRILVKLIEDRESPVLHDEELTLIASVDKVDLEEKSFTAKTPNGLRMSGYLNDVFLPEHDIFKEHKIECDGIFRVDDDLNVYEIKKEGDKRPVDLSPIQMDSLLVDNERLLIDPPLVYAVDLVDDDSCYSIDGELGVVLSADSRGELESALDELLQLFWRKFAIVDDTQLSQSGRRMKREVNKRISLK